MKYTAFISYKHSKTNTKKAEALEIALKKYAKPLLKPPIKIFRDEKEIRPGDDLKSTIIKALINSEYLIYLATKEAAESPWVQKEIKFWCDDLKRINKLIIIHIDDDIFIDPVKECIVWNKTNALPEILKNHIALKFLLLLLIKKQFCGILKGLVWRNMNIWDPLLLQYFHQMEGQF